MVNKPFLLRDTREKDGKGWYFASDSLVKGMITKKLDVGDYSLTGYEDKIFIDRKGCVSEFASNLVDERFERELQRANAHKYKYLLLEFPIDTLLNYPDGVAIPYHLRKTVKCGGNFLLKRMLELQLKYQFVPLFVDTRGKQVCKSILKRIVENEIGEISDE